MLRLPAGLRDSAWLPARVVLVVVFCRRDPINHINAISGKATIFRSWEQHAHWFAK